MGNAKYNNMPCPIECLRKNHWFYTFFVKVFYYIQEIKIQIVYFSRHKIIH